MTGVLSHPPRKTKLRETRYSLLPPRWFVTRDPYDPQGVDPPVLFSPKATSIGPTVILRFRASPAAREASNRCGRAPCPLAPGLRPPRRGRPGRRRKCAG